MSAQVRVGMPNGKSDERGAPSLEYSSTDILSTGAHYDSVPVNANGTRSQYDGTSSSEYYDAPSTLADKTQEPGTDAKGPARAKPPVRPRPSGAQLEAVGKRLTGSTSGEPPANKGNGEKAGSSDTPAPSYVRRLLERYQNPSADTSDGSKQLPTTESGIESDLSYYDAPYRRAQVAAAIQQRADAAAKAIAAVENAKPPEIANPPSLPPPSIPAAQPHKTPLSKRKRNAAARRRFHRRVPFYNATDTETNIDEYDDSATTIYDTDESDSDSGSDDNAPNDYAPPTVAPSESQSLHYSSSASNSSFPSSPVAANKTSDQSSQPTSQLVVPPNDSLKNASTGSKSQNAAPVASVSTSCLLTEEQRIKTSYLQFCCF